MVSQSPALLTQCLREEQLACDTFNSLNIGSGTYALLRFQDDPDLR